MTDAAPLSLALLGAGRIGQVHAGAIAATPGARLVAVADAVEKAAKSLAAIHGAQVRSIDAIAADPSIDAVLICTPTDTHADLIEKFARAGKAIFCEKPIDLSRARVRACLDVVAASGVPLMIGFNRRFDPDFAALKAALDAGRIGKTEMITITSRDPGPPPVSYITASGGIFKDMTIHDFDMARFLLGEEIATVQAAASVLVDPAIGAAGDFDSANVLLTTASGKHCVITNSRRASYGYDQRIEVLGAQGMLRVGNRRPVAVEVADSAGFTRPKLHDFFMTRYIEAYRAEIAAFIQAVATGTPPDPGGMDGLRALEIAEAAQQSVQSGQAVRL